MRNLLFVVLISLYTIGAYASGQQKPATSTSADTASAYDYGGLLAQVLQSNMVVQQGKPFTFWGNATPGETVTVNADWSSPQDTKADEHGVWKLKVDVPEVSPGDFTPHTVTVKAGSQTVVLKNILIGEVWFMSGQSNMSMCMKPQKPWHNGVTNHAEEIAAANYPAIRLYRNTKASADTPSNISNGTWKACTPQTAAPFSGVAYYFARKIFTETGYPVGIVLSALGGMSCQSFTPEETLKSDPVLKKTFWDPYTANPDMAFTKRPSHLYNGMIHPFINLSIRGFGWYQGESNAGHRKLYTLLCSKMIKEWRDRFAQGELPFYYVQMTPYAWKGNNYYGGGYAFFREAQAKIADIVPATGMVSTMDVGDTQTIHPSEKRTVGERLACLALHNDYGKKGVYKGPEYGSMKIRGNKVTVSFRPGTTGSGLNTRDGKAPEHFYVAGEDMVFYEAEAVIKGNTVVLTAPQVKSPVAVRYAFLTYPITNFQNKEGFSAYPFRTDSADQARYFKTR